MDDRRTLAEQLALSVLYRISVGEGVPRSEILAARTGLADAITAAKCNPPPEPLHPRDLHEPRFCPGCGGDLLSDDTIYLIKTDADLISLLEIEIGCAECGEIAKIIRPRDLTGKRVRIYVG